jgi:hypothetical protein
MLGGSVTDTFIYVNGAPIMLTMSASALKSTLSTKQKKA